MPCKYRSSIVKSIITPERAYAHVRDIPLPQTPVDMLLFAHAQVVYLIASHVGGSV